MSAKTSKFMKVVAGMVTVFAVVVSASTETTEAQSGGETGPATPPKSCDYRFESADFSVPSSDSPNHSLFYSAKAGCRQMDPRLVQYVIENGTRRLATEDKDKLLRNFTAAKRSSASDGRVYYEFLVAAASNTTGKERLAVISWDDPARRRIEIKQTP